MDNSKIKPATKLGIVGVVVSAIVVWLGGMITNTDLLGANAPKFGPLPVGSIVIVFIGVVGAIIGSIRKPNQ